MPILMGLAAALAWLGRQGTRALAASVFLGLAVPPLASYVKPYLGETVFVLLLFSYLRTDPAAFVRYLKAPGLTIVAAVWIMVAVPLLFGTIYALSGMREAMPALYTIMILQMAITPITSSAAFAALIGLDVAFSLAALIVSNAVSPLTTVAFSYLFLGTSMFSPVERGIKLFFFFAASGAVAYASHNDAGEAGEVAAIVPTADPAAIARAATEVAEELASALGGFEVTVGFSRHAAGPGELYRAGKEALLAVNVGEAERRSPLAFEETGSYRLLLPAMSEDPAELERFYDETVAPLAAYDEQYETELVTTVEAYLENDGNVTPTAETLYTHRHTVRYRLERVRELCGHDLSSTEGREKLGLGLKAMRVLGIPAPSGPAMESRRRRREAE